MITSRSNAAVREIRDALRRRPEGIFVLEGPHLFDEARRSGVSLRLALLSPSVDARVAETARAHAERVLEVSEDVLASACDCRTPQGVVALGQTPRLRLDDARARQGRLLLLDEVRDPGNLGTILRTAWASGFDAVLLTGQCVDPWNPKVVRASAGAIFHVPVIEIAQRREAGEWLVAHGQRVVRVTADGRHSCFEADLTAPVVLVLGNEAHGVHPDTAAFCTDSVHVPMAQGCESLNLAATAAILCYLSLDRSRSITR